MAISVGVGLAPTRCNAMEIVLDETGGGQPHPYGYELTIIIRLITKSLSSIRDERPFRGTTLIFDLRQEWWT